MNYYCINSRKLRYYIYGRKCLCSNESSNAEHGEDWKTTRDIELRLADLYSTGVPLPFECEYAAKVKDVDKTEKAFHTAFEPSRVNPKREFFNINPEQAIAVLSLMAIEDVTPSVQEKAKTIDIEATASAEKFKKKRRPTINYFEMGLKEGDILKFGRNEESCTVLNGRQVSYLSLIHI